jgi:hypothetical protein
MKKFEQILNELIYESLKELGPSKKQAISSNVIELARKIKLDKEKGFWMATIDLGWRLQELKKAGLISKTSNHFWELK